MPGAGQCQAALPTYSVLRFGGGALTAVHRLIKSWAALPRPSKRGIQWPCERASCMQEYGRRASGMRARTVRISRHAYHKMKEGGLLVARSVSAFEFVGNRTAYILLVSLAGTLECTETLEAPRHRSDPECRPRRSAPSRARGPRESHLLAEGRPPSHRRTSAADETLCSLSCLQLTSSSTTPVHEIENPRTVYTAGVITAPTRVASCCDASTPVLRDDEHHRACWA